MSDSPLPQCVHIRKAVTRGAHYSGILSGEQLPRLASLLDPDEARVTADVRFATDDEGRPIAEVSLEACVVLECQRCLGPVKQTLCSHSVLGLVPGDEQARALPPGYEPWIAVEEANLWEMAAEELALAVPVVAYHDEGECEAPRSENPEPEDETEVGADSADNPFSVLATLLDGSGDKEK